MRITEIALYTFSELDTQIQKRLIEEHRSQLSFDADSVIDGFREDMECYGATNVEVRWSGFHSQGDGACFTADFDTVKLLSSLFKYKRNYDKLINRIKQEVYDVDISSVRCGPSNFYCHENTVRALVSCGIYDDMTEYHQGQLIDLQNEITNWIRSESQALYDALESHWNECSSDEFITEDLDSLGDVFTKSGNQIAMRDIY